MLMALYLSAGLCQIAGTSLFFHLQRQWMNIYLKSSGVTWDCSGFFVVGSLRCFPFTYVPCTYFVPFAQHMHEVGSFQM